MRHLDCQVSGRARGVKEITRSQTLSHVSLMMSNKLQSISEWNKYLIIFSTSHDML